MYQLERFVAAQENIYLQAAGELSAGRKRSHWMWFIFPQLAGLGFGAMVLAVQGATVHGIFGSPDNMKFHASMTLFAQAAPDEALFRACLDKYFGGVPDQATLDLLHKEKQ